MFMCPSHHGRPDRGLSRRQRLKSNRDFQSIYAQRCKHVGCLMVLWVGRGTGASGRLGVVASRRIGGAVERNLARRRMREAFRNRRCRFSGERDFIMVARRNITGASQEEVDQELSFLMRRAGMMPGKGQR